MKHFSQAKILWPAEYGLRFTADVDDRMCHVRDTDAHPRVGAPTPVLVISYENGGVLFVACPRHLDHFSVIKVGILYKYNVAVARGVTSRDIFLWLTEILCVLNFMTSNDVDVEATATSGTPARRAATDRPSPVARDPHVQTP